MTRKRFTVIITALALLVAGTASYATFAVEPHTAQDNGQITQVIAQQPKAPTVQELLDAVNAERTRVGVQPLKLDTRLNQSAQYKADDMVKNNYLGHVDSNGKHGYTYAYDYNSDCKGAGENLVWNADKTNIDVSQAMRWWIGSTPHHTAMIDQRNISTGFGINGHVITEHFCKT